jgi:hypothetical protein
MYCVKSMAINAQIIIVHHLKIRAVSRSSEQVAMALGVRSKSA